MAAIQSELLLSAEEEPDLDPLGGTDKVVAQYFADEFQGSIGDKRFYELPKIIGELIDITHNEQQMPYSLVRDDQIYALYEKSKSGELKAISGKIVYPENELLLGRLAVDDESGGKSIYYELDGYTNVTDLNAGLTSELRQRERAFLGAILLSDVKI